MKSIMKHIVLIFLIIIVILSLSPNTTKAFSIDKIFEAGDNFIKEGQSSGIKTIDSEDIRNTSNSIYNTFFIVGMLIAVIVASILGIQFMLASAEDKAKIKETLIPFIIGCAVIFGSYGIWRMFVTLGSNM